NASNSAGGSGSDGAPGRWVRTSFIGGSSGMAFLLSSNQPASWVSILLDRAAVETGARRRPVAPGGRLRVSGEQPRDLPGARAVTAVLVASMTFRGCDPGLGNRIGSKSLRAAMTSAGFAENGCVNCVPSENRFTSASTWLLLKTNTGPLCPDPRRTKHPSV